MKPNRYNPLRSSATAFAFLLGMASSQAQVTLYAEYHLGEVGSLGANNTPQDSSGNAKHLTGHVGGASTAAATTGVFASGSTHYLNTANTANANEGFFGTATTYTAAPALPTNNFAFGIYARVSSNVAATQGEIFTLGTLVNNTYKLSLDGSGWRASSQNIGFIGNAAAVANNTWVHLAVIRSGGLSAFYVDGTQIGGTLANAPTIGQPHLSINPGNSGSAFDGNLDELRIVTFAPGEPIANILSVLTNTVIVPPGDDGTWVSTADGLWSDSSNWQDALIATDVDRTATFSASGGPIAVTLDSSRTIGNLVFSNANYTIGGTNVLTLSRSGIPGVSVDTGLTATLGTTVAGSVGLQKTGLGTLVLSGPNNSYSGTTTISGGTLQISGAGRLGSGTYASAISIATGATLQYSSSAGQTLSGAITGLGGITKDTNNSGLTLSSTSNTYSGSTTISAGRLAVTVATNLSSGTTSIVQSGTGQLFINNTTGTFNNPLNISTTGFAEVGDSQNNVNGAIRMGSGSPGSMTLSNTITLAGNSRISGFLGTAGTLVNTISGQITGGFGIDFYGFQTAAGTAEVFVLSNPANDYTGTTTIYNSNFNTTNLTGVSTTLRLGASNVIPDGASAGNVAFAINGTNNNAVVELDLFGSDETINGLTVNAGTFTKRITNTAAAANSVLTIGANDTTSSFSGTVTDSGIGRTLGITKIGTGTLTLSGTRTYIGDTTVSDGTLRLANSNPNDQNSTVTIAAGAFLDLTYGGTDTVDKLFIDGVQQPAGVYGPNATPLAQITNSSGTGTLTVSSNPPASGYTSWASLNGAGLNLGDDHDDDGVDNGTEFFIGGTTLPQANTTGFTPLPGVVDTDGVLSVTWTKAATYAGVYGTDYSVQTSETLVSDSWVNETTSPTLGFTVTFPTANEVKYTFPTPLGSKKFARLKVTGP